MTHRERVLAALRREPTDRAPIDLGGSRTSGIHRLAYQDLVDALGLDLPPPRLLDRMQQVVDVDGRVKDALDVDIETFEPAPPGRSDTELDGDRYRDEWGVERRMPDGGFWYDLSRSPLSGPISMHDILTYAWPDPDDPARYEGVAARAAALRAQTDRAICLGLRGSLVHITQFLRGFEDWYCDMAADRALMGALLDAVADVLLPVMERTLRAAAPHVDIVFIGDDLGHQRALQISPEAYRSVIKPRQVRIFEALRRGAPNAWIAYHTCGSVVEVLDDLVELGVQILNPVQVSAEGMDPAGLKARYGDRLAFWGGVDTQWTLPSGSADQVERETRARIEVLGNGGGYICGAVHNIQPDVPAANVLAMFNAAARAGGDVAAAV